MNLPPLPGPAASLQQWSDAARARLDSLIDAQLPAAERYPARLHEAMRYACKGGKRLRALLLYAAGEALAVPATRLDAPALAIELIHAYSLVHDDLPAMDDDQLRRGQPTCHVVFGEAMAILVGDALQTLAFEILAGADDGLPATCSLRRVGALARASGSRGMCGGQAVDIESTGTALSLAELEALHIHKTGALIRCATELASHSADNVDPAVFAALDRYGKCMGLAYQIQDDLLDVEASSSDLGKTAGKDAQQFKSTYPQVMGVPAARTRAAELFASAHEALQAVGNPGLRLAQLAEFIATRRH